MTVRATFKQADIDRACKGVVAAGLTVARIDFNGEGFSIVLAGADGAARRKNKADELYGPKA